MNKSFLAIFFSIMFLSLVMAPTLIMAIDHSIDISYIYDLSEEEEEKGKENTKEFEKFITDFDIEMASFITLDKNEKLEYTFKTYQKPHLNFISPPPELIL